MKKICTMLVCGLSFMFSGSIFADRAQIEDQGIKMMKVGGDSMYGTSDVKKDDMSMPEKPDWDGKEKEMKDHSDMKDLDGMKENKDNMDDLKDTKPDS